MSATADLTTSLCLNPRVANDRPPACVFAFDERCELLWCVGEGLSAVFSEPVARLRRFQYRRHHAIEVFDDFTRRAGRGCQPHPTQELILRQAGLRDRRHLGKTRDTFRAGNSERTNLARPDMGPLQDETLNGVRYPAARKIQQSCRAAFVR